jgi:hypothetical protein
MSAASRSEALTVSDLPMEDIAILPPGTVWQVPWELMMLGPFASCGLLDGNVVRYITVPAMVASALRCCFSNDAALVPADFASLPVFAPDMALLAAAVLVVETGWDLAVVMTHEPQVVTARSVYRALVGTDVVRETPASFLEPNASAVPYTYRASR